MIKRLKIAHQKQADKPIYLLKTGEVECGNFKYSGRYKKEFKEIFIKICNLIPNIHGADEFDVSEYKVWNAINIYNDYIVANWVESISAEQIEKFAIETEVKLILEKIRVEFKRALGAKWRRIFKNSNPNSPETPKSAWQIL